jgi:DNA-binding SARP family transcriptional activator
VTIQLLPITEAPTARTFEPIQMQPPAQLEFRVLGPVAAYAGGAPVELGDRKQRLVLAVLLLEANQLVPVSRLVRILWPDQPPSSARRIVQTHVSRLRSTLAALYDAAPESGLSRCGESYLLRCDPQRVDIHRFRSTVELARLCTQDEERVRILREAMSLWRGPALADVAVEEVRMDLCGGLEESRLAALEERLDAELRLGLQDRLIDELTELTTRHPYRQRMVGQLLQALHQVGRTADALRLYAGYRRRIADELGLEPSPELQRWHVRIQRAEPGATPQAGAVRVPGGSAPQSRPRQLPATVPGFVGREAYLAELGQALVPEETPATATPVVLVTGMAGVGKSALVTHWAHGAASAYPGGQLYVNLRGHAKRPPMSEREALTALLAGLGVAAEQLPSRTEDAAALYRSLLAGRRVLVLLDDAPGPDLVRALLPGSATCAVLVTSRDRLVGLVARNGATRIQLEPLELDEAVELAVRSLGIKVAGPDLPAVHSLVELCDRLPLAIRIAATLATDSGGVAAQVAAMTGGGLMDLLQIEGDEDAGVPAAFDRSYAGLPPDAAAMLVLLSTAHPAWLSSGAAARSAGTSVSVAERALRHLVNANLAREHSPDRYGVTGLLRQYAASRLVSVPALVPSPLPATGTGSGSGDWQPQVESATADRVVHLHAAAVRLDNATGDRQAETRPAVS